MKRAIKAIETEYNGYLFRSRLEARWAVFFDELGLRYEYEPEGFELPSGAWYLPDFRVWSPQGRPTWYEVKPGNIKSDAKFSEFFQQNIGEYNMPKGRVALLSGDPVEHLANIDNHICPRCGFMSKDNCLGRQQYPHNHGHGYMCYACDIDTPTGKDNPKEKGVANVVVGASAGSVITSKTGDAKFLAAVNEAAVKARRERFGKKRTKKVAEEDWDSLPEIKEESRQRTPVCADSRKVIVYGVFEKYAALTHDDLVCGGLTVRDGSDISRINHEQEVLVNDFKMKNPGLTVYGDECYDEKTGLLEVIVSVPENVRIEMNSPGLPQGEAELEMYVRKLEASSPEYYCVFFRLLGIA
jgi:predicted RNA-binding Zn-ribbon protein involved in translation (DUF1610 family)